MTVIQIPSSYKTVESLLLVNIVLDCLLQEHKSQDSESC